MTSPKSNITRRPPVYRTEKNSEKKSPDKFSDTFQDFDEFHVEVVFKRIANWPISLQRRFREVLQEDISAVDVSHIHNGLLELEDQNLSTKHNDLVRDLLNYIVSDMKSDLHGLPYIPESMLLSDKAEGKENASDDNATHHASSSNYILCVSIVLVLFVAIVYMCSNFSNNTRDIDDINNEDFKIKEWENNIIDLKRKFPSQNNKIWFNILSGIKAIVTEKPSQPSVFLLLHSDKETSACLARRVGKEAVKFLSESSQEPLIIKGEDLKMNQTLIEDYGLFTETYKEDIERKHVMVVLDLQEIPAVVAQTFHALCDVENPLVRNAAFLFTMQVNGNEKLNPTAIAEKNLKFLWKDSLDIDIMDPLITRVTNAVLPVKMEALLPC